MKKKDKNDKILILVRGGVVQCVYSTNKYIKIDLFDLDNEIFDSDLEEKQEFEKRSLGLKEIF